MTGDPTARLQQLAGQGSAMAFLTEYLTLAGQGYNCPIPSSLEVSGIKEGWTQIIGESLGASFDSEFLEDLSILWKEAVTKQGGQVTENFADQMLAIIQGQTPPPPAGQEPAAQTGGGIDQTQGGGMGKSTPGGNDSVQLSSEAQATAPSVSTPSHFQEVSSSISSDYRAIKDMEIPSMDKLQKNMSDCIARNKPLPFLKNYLTQIKHGKRPDVPMELNHKAIRDRWERIIMFGFGIAQPEFLDKLTDQWLNLVHVSGPMTDPQAIEKILEKIHINLSKEPKDNTPSPSIKRKKKNFFQKIFGM